MTDPIHILGKLERNEKIYRIFTREHFFSLFEGSENVLVSPKKWEDPFETVVLNAEVRTINGESGKFLFHDNVYGQCWSRHAASDAMWQIYSKSKNAIRVRTTVEKLINSLWVMHGERAHVTCFIGKVDYLSERKLKEFARSIFKNGITHEAIARSMLVKRKAYEHEREVRLIYIECKQEKHDSGIYKYQIDPRAVFDQAMVDGRVAYEKYKPFKKQITERTGFSEGQVLRSLLYSQPEGFVVEIP
jgi:hypothetical protein